MYQHSTLTAAPGHAVAPGSPRARPRPADAVSETAVAYLRTIYNLGEDGVPARRARLCGWKNPGCQAISRACSSSLRGPQSSTLTLLSLGYGCGNS